MGNVRRIYVEKKAEYAVKARELENEIRSYLGVSGVTGVRQLIRYDVEHISDGVFESACRTVFSEPPVDLLYREDFPIGEGDRSFSVEYLPGQFDQRADSAVQCVQLLGEDEEPLIRTAVTYVISGKITTEDFSRIKGYCINPVDSREADPGKPDTLDVRYEEPPDVAVLCRFCELSEEELLKLYKSLGLAMTFQDFSHIQKYFRQEERRDPTMTEIRVLDTYWSDHCRHTTFSTKFRDIEFGEGYYKAPMEISYASYLDAREEIYGDGQARDRCLMDLALAAMRKLKKDGKLDDLEPSDEINACSIVVPVRIDYGDGPVTQEWLVFFKNETHNHPTEIEPFGGAATCLGGAIRDPLSGRGYVYQAMRITGAADPLTPVSETLRGKLPQKKIVRSAAAGYSSYGNQVGLATGYVREIYHPAYVAKRMEIGAVMGAAPRENVIRGRSKPGDIVILLGGRTGRDGCGGATGSSKAHTEASIDQCGAEVQKGNAPTERKIQRLFWRPEVTRLIKKCNDFGAGGVSVAIGELADGLRVDLDLVPKKYAGLDGTELAISESQERMAVVLAPEHESEFLAYAAEENLEAVRVAVVTSAPRLVLTWRGKEIVSLSRAFLDTNGARQETDVRVLIPEREDSYFAKPAVPKAEEELRAGRPGRAWLSLLGDLNVCSQKGLVEMFDSSIGAGSVLMPFGGKYQRTPIQAMVAKLPTLAGRTDTVTMMAYGFDPYLSSWSPYHGAIYAVLLSIAKIVAAGGDPTRIRFTFQEYFGRMSQDPARWSQPFSALLGAYDAQIGFGLPSIGGKDSMSGTFDQLDVPPTLVSFAVDIAQGRDILTPELKKPGNRLVLFEIETDDYDIPVYGQAKELYAGIHRLIQEGVIVSAYAADGYGPAAALAQMAFGNGLGVKIDESLDVRKLFAHAFGAIVAEVPEAALARIDLAYTPLGTVSARPALALGGDTVPLEEAVAAWEGRLETVFPARARAQEEALPSPLYHKGNVYVCRNRVARPTVFIPVFPGTNCEYDSRKAFERAGATVEMRVFRNRAPSDILESVDEFSRVIAKAQIIMFPGGFSAGDEPDGSAKFFAAAFRNEKIKEEVRRLLDERDGLALGICNGFQALIKLGLVPDGKIGRQREDSPTLTFNTLGRHISRMVSIKVVSDKSPWMAGAKLGGVYVSPASHGEGRFVADDACLARLFANGQVATQYSDTEGNVSMDGEWNVNGSYGAIEGITSPDGRVLGKMAHAERRGDFVAVNIYGEQDMRIFESGVAYFR